MSLWINYEWDIERWEGDEIFDHVFADELGEFYPEDLAEAISGDKAQRLVLIYEAENTKQWAYVTNGLLPDYFSIPEADGNSYETNQKVPERFKKALARQIKKLSA